MRVDKGLEKDNSCLKDRIMTVLLAPQLGEGGGKRFVRQRKVLGVMAHGCKALV